MDKAIKKLRKKYIFSASAISFSVILVMLILLNVIILLVFRSTDRNAHEILQQAAHSYDYNTRTFQLAEMEKNPDGDYIIPCNVEAIDSVTLKGEISDENPKQNWCNAGGGLMFRLPIDGTEKFAYREYTFNKNTSEVTINFNDDNALRFEEQALLNESGLTEDNFLVSVVWWASSEEVSLRLESATVHYNTNYSKRSPLEISYRELFGENIPELVGETSSFFLITDAEKNLIAQCGGNLPANINEQEITDIIESLSENGGAVKLSSGTAYTYSVSEKNSIFAYTFLQNSSKNRISFQIFVISTALGIFIFLILFCIIIFVSKKVIAPISESFEKQKQFISNAGHELKTPVTVISATTDLLERKHGSDRLLDTIKTQSDKMGNLVGELLELSRLSEMTANKVQFNRFSVSDVVNHTILYFESRAFEEQHELISHISEEIYMNGDSTKMERLISILLDNALKYADEKSPVTVTLSENKDNVILTCSNPCAAMKQEQLARLFDRFYRSEESHSHEKEGFGLGLSIAEAITELHHGKITVSLCDKVVTFKVNLPK